MAASNADKAKTKEGSVQAAEFSSVKVKALRIHRTSLTEASDLGEFIQTN